jgi:protoheme IX farnesyltransferase
VQHETIMSGQSEAGALSVCPPETCCWGPCLAALWLLAKPGIVVAELVAALTGMLLVSPAMPSGATIFWLIISMVLAVGGAAMANGVMEAASDRLMPRLAARCLALERAGEKVVRTVAAAAMAMALILAATFLNFSTTLLLASAMVSYLCLYTARLKRTSPLAVLVGGIPGALPPLIGAAAVDSLATPALLLAAVIYCWQLPHFWFLALQYHEQYQRAGVPVFPLRYGEQITRRLILASTALLAPLPLLFGVFAISYWACAVMAVWGMGLLACATWAVRRRKRYRLGFFASLGYLTLLLATLVVDIAMHLPGHMPWGLLP